MSYLDPNLRSWCDETLGREIVDVAEVLGGGSRSSAILTLADGDRVFLRYETGRGPLTDTPFTLAREYAVLSALQHSDVPVPRCFAYSAARDAILMEFIPGFTSYDRTLSESEEAPLRRELMQAIAALQRLDPAGIPELAAGAVRFGDVLAADLDLWERLYRERVSVPDPLLAFALAWLRRDPPDGEAPAVITHGDIGPGNFLIHESHVAALIDWEMVRLGHPLEYLACIIARGLGAAFGSEREHVANYEAASGRRVSAAALDYALVLVFTRWTIAISIGLSRPTPQQNIPMLLTFRQVNARSLVAALCRREDLVCWSPEPRSLASRPATAAIYAYCEGLLRSLASADGAAPADRHRLAGAAELVRYLDAFTAYGPERYETEEVQRIEALLGTSFTGWSEAVSALARYAADPASPAQPIVAHLAWRVAREDVIMAEFLGSRADNALDLSFLEAEQAAEP